MNTQTEIFNADKLNYLITNNPYDLQPSEITKLKKYLYESDNGTIKRDYKVKDGGRLSAQGISLQNIKAEIRKSISNEYYNDLDIVNCMPTILKHICDENNVECNYLQRYVINRDMILKKHNITKININTIINSENIIEQTNDFLNNFQTEMKRIKKELIEQYEDDYNLYKSQIKTENNVISKFINKLMCSYETKIIKQVFYYLQKPENAVFVFDGLLLPKDIDIDTNKISEYIKSKLHLDIKFKIKDMIGYDFTNINVPVYKYPTYKYYNDYVNFKNKEVKIEQVKQWINNCLCVFDNNGIEYFVTRKQIKTKKEFHEGYFISKTNDILKTLSFYCNVINPNYDPNKETNKKKKINLKYLFNELSECVKHINKCGEIKTVFKIQYLPYLSTKYIEDSDDVFNTFTRYPMDNQEYKPKKDIDFTKSKLYNHLQTQFFNDDEDEFNHFLDHVADIIQDPQNIKGTAHLFISKQGTGKGTLTEFMKRLIGKTNTVSLENPETYFNTNFNTTSCNKLLKVFEELAVGGSAYKNYNRLKAEITAPTERVEPKGIDAYEINHSARYWFYTNHETGTVYIEGDDRRFTVHKIKDTYANNIEYFLPIQKEIQDDDFIYSAFKFFSNREYDEVNVRTSYTTKHKTKQKMNNLPVAFQYIINYIETNYKKTKDKDNYILLSDIKYKYKNYCFDNGTKYNFKTLITQLDKIKIKPVRKQIHGKRCMYININTKLIQNEIQKYLCNNFKFDYYEEEE
jgi:hypothetical protein